MSKKVVFRFLAVLLSVLLTLFIIEGALSLAHYKAPTYVTLEDYKDLNKLYQKNSSGVWAGNLGNVLEFKNTVTTNSLGFHDTEHSFEKPANTYRILCLGDSFVESWQVSLNDTFFKILEKSLNEKREHFANKQIEVIAIGASGDGSIKETEKLTEFGLKFQPDLVITFLTDQNDFKDDLFLLKEKALGPKKPDLKSALPDPAVVQDLRLYKSLIFFKNSHLNRWLAFKITEIARSPRIRVNNINLFKMDLAVFLKDNTPMPEQIKKAWTNTVTLTAGNHIAMKSVCEKKGISFAVVLVDNPFRYDPAKAKHINHLIPQYKGNLDFSKPVNQAKNLFAKYRVKTLDLSEGFETAFRHGKKSLHFRYDNHWTQEGHKLAASLIEDFILNQ